MVAWMAILLAVLCLAQPAHAEQDVLWERYFEATRQAFEHGNYLEAHRMFAATKAAAARSGQNIQFARKLESLAGQYEHVRRFRVAEALYRNALHIYERCLGPAHSSLIPSMQKYARVLRNLNRDQQANRLEARARDMIASDNS